jgi:acetyl esterase/lipase
VLLVIHGGGFIRGDKSSVQGVATDLAEQGYLALAINYTLGDTDAAVLDGQDAVRWARAHAADYGVTASPVPVGAVGGSAGATLADMLAITGTAGDTQVEAAVACSGPTTHELPMPDPDGRMYPDPASQDLSNSRPIDLYNSTDEVIPFEQSQYLYDELVEAGRVTRLTALEGDLHAFAYWGQIRDSAFKWLETFL